MPCIGCSTDNNCLTEELVKYMHSKGLFSYTWTLNTVSAVKNAFGYTCDYVITDTVKESDL